MKERELDTPSAGHFAWAAARDADRYSDECRMLYTAAERAKAETFMDLLKWAYAADKFYLTYRKGFVSIKMVGSIVRERRYVREIDSICEERGYDKVRTQQGLTFRIPKAK